MNIGIVGHEAAKFTPAQEAEARRFIRVLLRRPTTVAVSGHCPLGGVDLWTEEIADALGRKKLIFPAEFDRCEPRGFKARNIKIAEASDWVFVIVVKQLPSDYSGRRFTFCYHCKTTTHIKSGGCWTAKYAESVGKKARWLEL